MNPIQWLRIAKWARNPPSDGRVKLLFGVLIVVLLIAGIERFVGWPDWLTLDPQARRGPLR